MVKYLAYSPVMEGADVPPQGVEEHVVEEVTRMGFEMPPVRRGWFAGNSSGGQISTEQFAGARPIWYWEVV